MHNLETPTLKLGLFKPSGSFGQALIAGALQRQHEVTVLLDDLNRLRARPGLRCKLGSLDSSIVVSQAVSGLDVVFAFLADQPAEELPPQCGALIDGALRAEVPRLLLVGHWGWLVEPADADQEQLGAGLARSLEVSGLDWTLVEAPPMPEGLRIDDFSRAGSASAEDSALALSYAEALLDEMQLSLHSGQCLRLRSGEE
ncbi:NAD(P)H-binding protein [Pseudomonas sp. BGr12]|uniref:NAD(P)H-binding protein n=1 Tax=unclassified Pseudomonas TaxID=196821 RepID=UPI00177D14B2|nr:MULTISPECIES: NAD(P)H-binding protein [unclassified Pseudomonas]MBD9504257.1 NAD(P)H-binding protein [Pseudomonas sp. PDM17]MBD9578700.1 NAD(P)H-binding protein [Pseudomonas sp. PDM23]MBD9674024.1 NAD(P)H-binding protein [Pseudomonas sp. PDM21]MDL2429895.1 SDR family oxidoreductase [Pseudomonas sp. BJa5]